VVVVVAAGRRGTAAAVVRTAEMPVIARGGHDHQDETTMRTWVRLWLCLITVVHDHHAVFMQHSGHTA